MPFHPCPSGCGRFLSADDGHNRCLQCLGFQRAEDAFVDDSCTCCGHMSMTSLFPLSHLSFTFTFMHLADAFIQSNLQCIQAIHFLIICVTWETNRQPFALQTQCSTTEPLSFLKGLAPSAAIRAGFSSSSREPPAGTLGDLRVTVRASLPGTPHGPLTPHAASVPSGSRVISLVRSTGRPAFHFNRALLRCLFSRRCMSS